jgi:Uma2 family endonuclease
MPVLHEPILLTVDDLLGLPDDDGRRHELVDGILIVSPPPSVAHQEIAHRIRESLAASAPDGWRVRTGFPLWFAEDTLRVPDVMAFRHPLEHGSPNQSFGIAPADVGLVVEVVSPSSCRTDRFAKPGEYADAGITHFWRVEQEPTLAVHPFVLVGASYRPAGVVTGRGRVPTPWGDIDLDVASLGF